MTTEEKAKAYDEAIKKAKEIKEKIVHSHLSTESSKAVSEYIDITIPELCKSDDERIRRQLINVCNDWLNGDYSASPCLNDIKWLKNLLEKQKDASYAIEAVDRIDKYIDEHLANAHDMKDSNPDKKYYRGWDDALGEMARILQDVYSEKENKFTPRVLPCSAAWFEDGDEKQKEQRPMAQINGEPISTENQVVKVGDDESFIVTGDDETEVQKYYREGQNAGRQEVFDNPGAYGLENIDNVFGFRIGDKVRLKDGDGRPHIIKYFEKIEGLHGPDFYRVIFEDNTASDHIIPGDEYLNGYYTNMEKIDGQKEQKPTNSEKPKEYKSSDGVEMIVMSPYEAEFCQKFCDHTPDHYSPDGWKLIKNYYAEFKEIVMRELAEQKPEQYSSLCKTIKDKIREYMANHFVADTVVKTDAKSIVKAMEEGVRLGKEEQKKQKPERINIKEMVAKYGATDEYVDGDYKGKPVNCMIRAYEQGIRDTLLKVKEQKPVEYGDDAVEEAEEYTSKVDCGEYGVAVTEAYIAGVLSERNRKPVEWSEEDKKILHGIERCVYDNVANIGTVNKVKYIDFLKSFRPSWKPSEEQMEAVRYFVNKHQSEAWAATGQWKQFTALRELLGELQRL